MEQPRLAVVVLNWRNAADTLDCLASLRLSTTDLDVIVVDNDSGDGSADLVEESGLATTVLRNPQNDGYAGGNNVGLRHALSLGYEFIAVLNNDTVADAETFSRLLETCRRSGDLVAVSPRITYADQPDLPWFAGGVLTHGLPRHLQPEELVGTTGVVESDLLSGCCLLASAATWSSVGLFDEDYFLIFEDSEWSLRARGASARLLVDHDAGLRHKVSRSLSGPTMSLVGTYFFVRNGLTFESTFSKRHVPLFLWTHVVRPLVRERGTSRGRFALLGFFDWMRRRRGNAAASVWKRAEAAS